MSKHPQLTSINTCGFRPEYQMICVYCPKVPVCKAWYPMQPGMTLRKWHNWLKRK